MLDKKRYDFESRFNSISEKVLSFNGLIPQSSSGGSPLPQKPNDFESYQIQRDPDYTHLKNAHFMTEPIPPAQNASNQMFLPQINQQDLTNQSALSYSPSLPKIMDRSNLHVKNRSQGSSLWENDHQNNQPSMAMMPKLRKQQQNQHSPDESNAGDSEETEQYSPVRRGISRNSSLPSLVNENALLQLQHERRVMDAWNAQQFQIQQQQMMLIQQQERELAKQKAKRREEKLMRVVEPLLKNQTVLMEAIVKRINESPTQQQARPTRENSLRTKSELTDFMIKDYLEQRKRHDYELQQQLQYQQTELQNRLYYENRKQQDMQMMAALAMGQVYQQSPQRMSLPNAPILRPSDLNQRRSINPRNKFFIQGLFKDMKR